VILERLLRKYLSGKFQQDFNILAIVQDKINGTIIGENHKKLIKKYLMLFFVGHLVGLRTLNSLIEHFSLSSNTLSAKYTKLCSQLKNSDISSFFSKVFEQILSNKFAELSEKHPCIFSRETTTAVLDDSVFRCWLESQDEDTLKFHNRFFSGQYGCVVSGFQVVVFGISIGDTFYPLYLDFVQKSVKEGDSKATTDKYPAAVRLINKWKEFHKKLKDSNVKIKNLYLSCDSGYNHSEIIAAWGSKLISVPKKNNKVTIDGISWKITDYIEKVFLVEEKAALLVAPNKAFTKRVRAKYHCRNVEVTLLFFRYNKSKNVSVVYSTDLLIKEKTIRRNWFQRTYIEQYFKIIKHVLQIQQTRPQSKSRFEINLCMYMFLALQVQCLTKWIRKECDIYERKGFVNLRHTLMNSPWIKSYLSQSVGTILQ
jgi:hypothetical protein